ncbi:MBL fold metallo-hydrolase [Caballeronia humi]|uniref:Metallo-beta-lactamase superfamily protein n=1 Tax=Caballeronia humi TaxID=326474 RepID=A0A158JKD7_9BURK|nr:MBL fold metallo-hydrolase [Caballeronia humi]SAL68931.1 Metallo-beta-lactamase superfamily protein [Caballeronia humi]
MNKLVALPVSGDSYLLQRCGQNVLVDGGYSSRALVAALSSPRTELNHLHIVVCTHADKDHAGGFTDLLDNSSITVGEFWLPTNDM